MPDLETLCGERSPYARCASALWVPIRAIVILAGLCWLALNAAIFTGYMQSADPFSMITFDLESISHSNQASSGEHSSSSVPISDRYHSSSDIPASNSSRKERKNHLLFSGTGKGHVSVKNASDPHINYAAVGKIRPSETGEYIGAGPDRMHGRLGLYTNGTPAYVPTSRPDPNIPIQELLQRGGGFNILLSDHLPLDREAVDARTTDCKQQQYDMSKLPKASVIIIFFNESFSTLLRSVHSVLNRTPPQLLEEIILVDDGSTLDYIRGFRRVKTAAAAEAVGDEFLSLAAELRGDKALVDDGGREEDEDEERRKLTLLRNRMQPEPQQPLPGSPNYRASPTLVEYIELLPEKVKLLRNKERKGIVGARMHGIRAAIAPIFVILDSHVEVQPQWLEPLLLRIAGDRRRIVMPQIDGSEADTFEYVGGGIGCKLGFLWKLMEHSYEPHQLARVNRTSAKASFFPSSSTFSADGDDVAAEGDREGEETLIQKVNAAPGGAEVSPVMAGGLFAAEKEFFFEIGAYDEAFEYWGTENLELSFRLWQCGGILECAPCSRVYHIFRKGGGGYSLPPSALTVNKMRTMLWMDQYADLAWRVLGKPRVDFGWESLQQRKKWREDKKCKGFKWFLNTVFPESDVLDLRDVPYLGPLKNKGAQACLGVNGYPSPGGNVSLQPCRNLENQEFMYFRMVGHIMPVRDDEACLEVSGRLEWCKGEPKHEWKFTVTGLLLHPQTQKCLSGYGNALHAVACDDTDRFQMWSWTAYNPQEQFKFPPPPSLRGV